MEQEFDELFAIKEYKRSPDGVLSFILGSISAVVFLVLSAVCTFLKGDAGMWAGSIGITAFLLAFIGMVPGLGSFQDQCRSYRISRAGTLLSGVMVAVWFLTCCVGLSS